MTTRTNLEICQDITSTVGKLLKFRMKNNPRFKDIINNNKIIEFKENELIEEEDIAVKYINFDNPSEEGKNGVILIIVLNPGNTSTDVRKKITQKDQEEKYIIVTAADIKPIRYIKNKINDVMLLPFSSLTWCKWEHPFQPEIKIIEYDGDKSKLRTTHHDDILNRLLGTKVNDVIYLKRGEIEYKKLVL